MEAEQVVEKQADEQTKVDEQLADYKAQTQALSEQAGKDKKSHLLAAARMQIGKEFLADKNKILDEVFDQARRKLRDLSDDEYRALVTRFILAAVETGDEEVIVDNNETRIDHDFIKQVNRQLGPGYKGNLRLSNERQDLGSGFILKRGKIKTNVSLEVLLAQARKELEIELAKDLFAD